MLSIPPWSSLALARQFADENEKSAKLSGELQEKLLLEDRLEEAHIRASKASLQMLRYQLNPHFLFNALASIRGAISVDTDAARDMLSALADFCRLTLSNGAKDFISVEEEIALIREYTRIETARLDGYLEVHVELDSTVAQESIPSFLLQPLVENAVKYGKKTSPDSLRIDILVHKPDASHLNMVVTNTGTWVDSEQSNPQENTSIGLKNLQNRLQTTYPDDHSLVTSAANGRVRVEVIIPI